MKAGNIFSGPGLFDLGLALMDSRGRNISFEYMDGEDNPAQATVYVNSIDNGCSDGTFVVQGFKAGSDSRYKATYSPITGKGTIEF